MRSALRRTALAGLTGTLLLTGSAGSALALPGDGGDEDPFDCATKVSATMTASASNVASGSPVTIGWSVSAPLACNGEVTYKVGTSFSGGTSVGKTGSKVYTPLTGTTYRLYADFGDHYSALASKTVLLANEIPLTIDLNTFKASDVQEEGGTSNGDEPWLIVVPILADGRTVDATNLAGSSSRVFKINKSHENLGHLGVDDGATFAIPDATGEFHTTLQPWRNLPTSFGKKAATAGVAVIAIDEDATSDGVADAVVSATTSAVKAEVDKLIKAAKVPTESDLAQLQANVADAALDTAVAETLATLDVPGMLDPDDFIGAGFVSYSQTQIEAAGSSGLPVNMTLTGDGASYQVSGAIRRG